MREAHSSFAKKTKNKKKKTKKKIDRLDCRLVQIPHVYFEFFEFCEILCFFFPPPLPPYSQFKLTKFYPKKHFVFCVKSCDTDTNFLLTKGVCYTQDAPQALISHFYCSVWGVILSLVRYRCQSMSKKRGAFFFCTKLEPHGSHEKNPTNHFSKHGKYDCSAGNPQTRFSPVLTHFPPLDVRSGSELIHLHSVIFSKNIFFVPFLLLLWVAE